MRPARSLIGLALLFLSFGVTLAGCDEPGAWSRATGGDGQAVDRFRPAAASIERQRQTRRERRDRRDRRDRTRERFGRGSAELLPHLGDYVVHESGFATARFKRAKGTLTIDLIDDCGDWTLQEKWDLQLEDQGNEFHRSDLLYRASEITSTERFRFAYSRNHLGETADFIGDVLPIDDGYQAVFMEPEIPDLFLPPEVVFPITHFRQVVAAARRGSDEFESLVFDGGNEFPYRAVVGVSHERRRDDRNTRVTAARTELDRTISDRLPAGRHWPVRIDYFPADDPYAPAVFTREFLLHENGIILGFHFDYGDIQLDARLRHLDIREREEAACPE